MNGFPIKVSMARFPFFFTPGKIKGGGKDGRRYARKTRLQWKPRLSQQEGWPEKPKESLGAEESFWPIDEDRTRVSNTVMVSLRGYHGLRSIEGFLRKGDGH